MYIEKNLKQNRRLAFGYSRIFGHELPDGLQFTKMRERHTLFILEVEYSFIKSR